jgi:anthranilate phosphoribosyltransferase
MSALRPYLQVIAEGATLDESDAEAVMHVLLRGECSPEETAALLMGLRSRGEAIDELTGFTRVMREYMLPVKADDPRTIDLCGTGGDGSGTFNISTAAALVCAGAGAAVAKHGNRSVSSQCGSADVLAVLGVKTDLGPRGASYCLSEAGIAFLFAPHFHPALRFVMPVRRQLGVRTFFNILGPLCNPAGVRRQLTGAFNLDTARQMADILLRLGAESAFVAHSDDGMDELSISVPTTIFRVDGEKNQVNEERWSPRDLGFETANLSALQGGDSETNAAIIAAVLDGELGPRRDVVVLNAAFALRTSGRYEDLPAACEAATEAIDSGGARAALTRLAEVSHAAPEEAP